MNENLLFSTFFMTVATMYFVKKEKFNDATGSPDICKRGKNKDGGKL